MKYFTLWNDHLLLIFPKKKKKLAALQIRHNLKIRLSFLLKKVKTEEPNPRKIEAKKIIKEKKKIMRWLSEPTRE